MSDTPSPLSLEEIQSAYSEATAEMVLASYRIGLKEGQTQRDALTKGLEKIADMKGRPKMNKELERLRARLAAINAGLLACYETIAIGQQKKAALLADLLTAMEQKHD